MLLLDLRPAPPGTRGPCALSLGEVVEVPGFRDAYGFSRFRY